jgi:hypothetical protein
VGLQRVRAAELARRAVEGLRELGFGWPRSVHVHSGQTEWGTSICGLVMKELDGSSLRTLEMTWETALIQPTPPHDPPL